MASTLVRMGDDHDKVVDGKMAFDLNYSIVCVLHHMLSNKYTAISKKTYEFTVRSFEHRDGGGQTVNINFKCPASEPSNHHCFRCNTMYSMCTLVKGMQYRSVSERQRRIFDDPDGDQYLLSSF